MSIDSLTDIIDKMLPIVDRWKQQHGEAIAKELITAYLTGISHSCRVLSDLGSGNMSMLYDRLRGN